jgi:hypothetical protein
VTTPSMRARKGHESVDVDDISNVRSSRLGEGGADLRPADQPAQVPPTSPVSYWPFHNVRSVVSVTVVRCQALSMTRRGSPSQPRCAVALGRLGPRRSPRRMAGRRQALPLRNHPGAAQQTQRRTLAERCKPQPRSRHSETRKAPPKRSLDIHRLAGRNPPTKK